MFAAEYRLCIQAGFTRDVDEGDAETLLRRIGFYICSVLREGLPPVRTRQVQHTLERKHKSGPAERFQETAA